MIRPCRADELYAMAAIINAAAEKYRGAIPADRFHDPYMSLDALKAEIAAGVRFWGYDEGGLLGVMGIQTVKDRSLIRHAYVRPDTQGKGVGSRLIAHLLASETGPVLVGTWAAASWAISFYQRHGFELVAPDEKTRLLKTYWSVPERQIETSVVLQYGARNA